MRIIAVTALTAFAFAGAAAAQAQTKSLYERLGGQAALVAVVDDFVVTVAADKRINHFFASTDIAHLKKEIVDQICNATGGPCSYTGKDMKTAHAGMGVTAVDFDALVQDLGKTLNKFKVPKKEQNELVAILAPLRGDIVAH